MFSSIIQTFFTSIMAVSLASSSYIPPQQEQILPPSVLLDVTFTSQAPTGDWSLPYKEACEEASIIMVKYFLHSQQLTKDIANKEIVALTKWVEEKGYGLDISAQQTLDTAVSFYGLHGELFYGEEVTVEKIKQLLNDGYPVIIPAAGRILDNPNYLEPGPVYHMIVIIGYDGSNFITHDPGTQFGANFKYSYQNLYDAIKDCDCARTSNEEVGKAMLILYR